MIGEVKIMLKEYPASVAKWSVFEAVLEGPSDGNPFTEQRLTGIFTGKNESVVAEGFYDGDGIYRIRFMPSYEGRYTFVLKPSWDPSGYTGKFYAGPAEEGNHGPVRVSGTHHFAYEDAVPFHPVGTTAYVFDLQSDEQVEKTLACLEEARFNKIRFCVLPKHYIYNFHEPVSYPYEGTPMDSSVLTEANFMQYSTILNEPDPSNHFDFTRFNPAHFRRVEKVIEELGRRGIEADLIIMHPYDRWGFACMSPEQDDLYWNYVIARFSAYHNVWWALANEFDLMRRKSQADWERWGAMLVRKDPYHHLRSIHNCRIMYDHSRPWITHCSVQRVDLYKGAELTGELAQRYGKPVVMDEIAYEGNISDGWGNITAEEMVRRFWETAVRGGYPGHGETLDTGDGILWWSHGTELRGESWKRAGFLLDILSEVPGSGLVQADMEWDSVCGVPEDEWLLPVKSQYIFYYSFMRPSFRTFHIDENTEFAVDIIDTWNMTVTKAGVHHGTFRIDLPAKQYMAVRLRRPEEADYAVVEEPVQEEEPEELPVEEIVESAFTEPDIFEEETPEEAEEITEPETPDVTAEAVPEEETEEIEVLPQEEEADDVFEVTAEENDDDAPQLIEEPLPGEETAPPIRQVLRFRSQEEIREPEKKEEAAPQKEAAKDEVLEMIGELYDETLEEDELPEIVTASIPFVNEKPVQRTAPLDEPADTLDIPLKRFGRG